MAYDGPWKRTGTFAPKVTRDLRPEVVALIDRRFQWDYAGMGCDDEPYPGQSRWMPARKHDAELGRAAAYWVPEEDITWDILG